MNIKLNIGKNKRDSEKRESNGMNEREKDSTGKLVVFYGFSWYLYIVLNKTFTRKIPPIF